MVFVAQHALLGKHDAWQPPPQQQLSSQLRASLSRLSGAVSQVRNLSWTPFFVDAVPADRIGLASEVWQQLQQQVQPSAAAAARQLLQAAVARNASLSVVQVGACDGNWAATNDPVQELLRDPRVRALALEPVPKLWRELQQRLAALPDAEGRLFAVNKALCLESAASVPFFVVSPKFAEEHPDAAHWVTSELGSFKRSHLRKHHIPDRFIAKIDVPCLDPPALFAASSLGAVASGPAAVDAVVVDAEGFDADLVEAMLSRVPDLRPALLILEQKHVPRVRLQRVLDTLRSLRYVHWQDNDQLVALLAAPSADLAGEQLGQRAQPVGGSLEGSILEGGRAPYIG